MKKGFTIIELMVAIAIMVFILAVILVNYKKFDSGIVMTNLAYDVALSIRTAQTYGVSVKGNAGNFTKPYGISFKIDSSWEKKYLLFLDTDSNGLYGATDGTISTYNFRSAYYIKNLCSYEGTGGVCTDRTQIDITFKRPDPDALIKIYDSPSTVVSAVEIVIGSKQDASAEKTITVRPTGQISVE